MGLLNNNFPDDLLELIRNAAQNRSQSANSGAGSANDLPSWVPRQQQRLPLSFAGPILTPDINASPSSPPRAVFPLPGPADASADAGLSWLRGDRSADPLRARPPAPPAPNLTVHALRMKGVPEADIAAAMGNPERIRQLIMQNYGPGSGGTPPWIRHAADGSGASSDPSGYTRPNDILEGNWFDSAGSRQESIAPQAVQLKCVGWNGCQNGGSFGHGGMYSVGGQTLCESCAVKKLGGELLPSNEKTDLLRPYLMGGGK
jgi:hypothetical protein